MYGLSVFIVSVIWVLCLIALIHPTPQLGLRTQKKALLASIVTTIIMLGLFEDEIGINSMMVLSPKYDSKAVTNPFPSSDPVEAEKEDQQVTTNLKEVEEEVELPEDPPHPFFKNLDAEFEKYVFEPCLIATAKQTGMTNMVSEAEAVAYLRQTVEMNKIHEAKSQMIAATDLGSLELAKRIKIYKIFKDVCINATSNR